MKHFAHLQSVRYLLQHSLCFPASRYFPWKRGAKSKKSFRHCQKLPVRTMSVWQQDWDSGRVWQELCNTSVLMCDAWDQISVRRNGVDTKWGINSPEKQSWGSQAASLKAFLVFLHFHLGRRTLFMQLQELPKSQEGANLFRPTRNQKWQRKKKISWSRAWKTEGRSKGMRTGVGL